MKTNTLTMKELPESERPYEKCRKLGIQALTDAELLAVIIKSGTVGINAMDTAVSLLMMDPVHPGLEGLKNASMPELMTRPGIGQVKAIQLLAAVELSRRLTQLPYHDEKMVFTRPETIADYYRPLLAGLPQEELHMLMLDTKGSMLGECMLSRGTVNSSPLDTREIFRLALRSHAVGIILVHNHPSGDPTPSEADIEASVRVMEAGELMGVRLVDHVIIGGSSFCSLSELGCI